MSSFTRSSSSLKNKTRTLKHSSSPVSRSLKNEANPLLIQVFDYDNLGKSSYSQKEDLIQRVLQLGRDNYTYEELKRDMLSFENAEKNRKTPSRT